MWRTSYLAVSAALGDPVEEAAAALGGALAAAPDALALALALRGRDKRARAAALVPPLAALRRALDAAGIA